MPIPALGWNQLTPLQSFDVDTVNGTGYIWEGSVVKKDASSVYIAARGLIRFINIAEV
jgi:hypothetical protein